jgi:hypothetical protein
MVDCVWNVMAHAQKSYFVFRRNGRVHLNRRGASVQSITGSRDVANGGSNAGYTMFRGSVKSTGYPIHSPVSPSLSLPASPFAITFQLDSSNAGYTMFRVSVKSTGYPLHSHFPFTSRTVRHRVPSHFNYILQGYTLSTPTTDGEGWLVPSTGK